MGRGGRHQLEGAAIHDGFGLEGILRGLLPTPPQLPSGSGHSTGLDPAGGEQPPGAAPSGSLTIQPSRWGQRTERGCARRGEGFWEGTQSLGPGAPPSLSHWKGVGKP